MSFFVDLTMTIHIPVLLDEVIEQLAPKPGDIILDGTLGGGGHTQKLLEWVGPTGHVIGIDRDPLAVAETEARLNLVTTSQLADSSLSEPLPHECLTAPQRQPSLTAFTGNYASAPEILKELGIEAVNGIVLDLGLSSDQLADRDRGFSYQSSGPLDLRFNSLVGEPASRILNRLSERHLADLIYEFGEERFSRRIARKIVETRRREPMETAEQLARLVRSCVPRSKHHDIDPATRTFQALRIAVNEELKWLKIAMARLPGLLVPGGRIAVISFHSLEDRIVKQSLRDHLDCKVLTKKPITASDAERQANPRSRSAKLRVAERMGDQRLEE